MTMRIAMMLTVVMAGCGAEPPDVECRTGSPVCGGNPRFDDWADVMQLCADGEDVWLPDCADDSVGYCSDTGAACEGGAAPTCVNVCDAL